MLSSCKCSFHHIMLCHGATLEKPPLFSTSDNDKYVAAMSHQSHDLQPRAGAHRNDARQGSHFSALSDLAKPVVLHAGARAGQQAWMMPKSREVIKQAGLGLASEKEGARGLQTFLPTVPALRTWSCIISALPRCH